MSVDVVSQQRDQPAAMILSEMSALVPNDLSNSDDHNDSVLIGCLRPSSTSATSSSASTSNLPPISTAVIEAKSPVVIDLTNQSYWSWFLFWKLRSWRERVVATVSPVPFAEFDLIPDEIWLQIFSYIDTEADIFELRAVCRQFARICNDRSVVSRFTYLKLPRMPSGHLNTVPIAVMMVGDHHIGKTALATAFLTDCMANTRQGFGTRHYSRSRHARQQAVLAIAPAPTSSRFQWLKRGGGAQLPAAASAEAVYSVSLFDVANGAVAPRREILAFPMLCHCIAVCFSPYDNGIESVSEWINKAHATTEKMRNQQGLASKAPVLLLCIRNNNKGGAQANPVDGVALRQVAKELSRKHGVDVIGHDVAPFEVLSSAVSKNLNAIDRAFGSVISLTHRKLPTADSSSEQQQ
jgi:hypothetical protein